MEDRAAESRKLGAIGEEMACRFLAGRGHLILERNFRCGHLEIDIISRDSEGIHFVEVKTRRESIQAPPQENVGAAKQAKIVKAAGRYLKTKKLPVMGGDECFFDVVAITFRAEEADVEYFPQAYVPLYL